MAFDYYWELLKMRGNSVKRASISLQSSKNLKEAGSVFYDRSSTPMVALLEI